MEDASDITSETSSKEFTMVYLAGIATYAVEALLTVSKIDVEDSVILYRSWHSNSLPFNHKKVGLTAPQIRYICRD